METNTKSSSLDWIIFFVSLVITLGLLFTVPEWFWVPLPFVLTYFVKAMDWMQAMGATTRIWQTLNVVGLLAVIVVNALANALPINGRNTGELSDLYPNLFVPAGLTFSIWGIIYLLLLVFVGYGLSKAAKPYIDRIGPWFVVSCVANVSWILAWHYRYVELSLFIMLCLLGSLIMIYQQLGIGQQPALPAWRWRVHIPFSVYLGWISIATIANTTALLVYLDWDGFGMGPVAWAVVMIVIGMLLTVRMLIVRRDLFYALVVIWAYLGIIIKRNAVDLAGTTPIIIVAVIAIVLIGFALVTRINSYRRLYTPTPNS